MEARIDDHQAGEMVGHPNTGRKTGETVPHRFRPISRRAFLKTAVVGTAGLLVGCSPASLFPATDTRSGTPALTDERWAASTDLNIVIHSPAGSVKKLTSNGNDFKPSWSRDGRHLCYLLHRPGGATPTLVIRETASGEERELLPAAVLLRTSNM